MREASGPEEWTLDAVHLGHETEVFEFERVRASCARELMGEPRATPETLGRVMRGDEEYFRVLGSG